MLYLLRQKPYKPESFKLVGSSCVVTETQTQATEICWVTGETTKQGRLAIGYGHSRTTRSFS